MLSENIKNLRKAKGLSQEEFALKCNVVRQTVSKWERGLSVPDSDMLLAVSEALDTPVSVLLGETLPESAPENDLKVIAEKLEVINLQLSRKNETRRRVWFRVFVALAVLLLLGFFAAYFAGEAYLRWDFSDPESSVAGTVLHAFSWLYVRLAPLGILAAVVGAVLTGRRKG